MALLEWKFLQELRYLEEGRWHGIPNLERVVADSPRLFAQAVALGFDRSNGGQDPADWRVDDSNDKHAVARNAWALLERLRRIPGTNDDGIVQTEPLREWCAEVRRLSAEHGRSGEGDFFLGQLLSHAWSCQAVCEVMESIGSPSASRGFWNGIYNARGGQWRGMEEGGDQEREIAASWRSRAQTLANDYPFFSGVLAGIATQYEQEATENDLEMQVRKRAG